MAVPNRNALISNLSILEAEAAKRDGYKIKGYFPDSGQYRRDLYVGAMEFFRGGFYYPERLLLGGNRVGKTNAAAYEVTLHLTGLYPDWWEGRRFNHPVEVWASGDTATTTRDIQQLDLYGPIPTAPRTGMIPAHLIKHASAKTSIPNAVETVWVKHVSGGDSSIQFKSYDQRRLAFQGTSKHVIWLDEECPDDIYTECLLRTLTCQGITLVTFTPVEGLTPFLQSWLEHAVMFQDRDVTNPQAADAMVFSGSQDESVEKLETEATETAEGEQALPIERRQKLVVMIAWDEVPHLSKAAQDQMLSEIPVYQRAARTRGIPNLGSGVIYPIPEEDIKIAPFKIPDHWPRGYGMDVGWNWTVALWGAFDRETGTWYIYHEHHRSHAEPPVHAAGIKGAGDWIPGRIDPAANGRSQVDGRQLMQLYLDLGLTLDFAPNGVEAGIYNVWTEMTAGKIKIFSNLRYFFTEYRMYRRDAKGRVIKKNDHEMDCLRYLLASGVEWLAVNPAPGATKKGPVDGGHVDLWLS